MPATRTDLAGGDAARSGRPWWGGEWPAPVRYPLLLVPAALGASSVATLLLYFIGIMELSYSVRVLLLPAVVMLVGLTVWAKRTQRLELYDRIVAGLWAGTLATLAYDIVRVPIAWSGLPIFKAISYFGTVLLGQRAPTPASEVVGWAYHLSNGVGFGLVYATLFAKPRLLTAVAWGILLEVMMLYTPYAEVFGYKRSGGFYTITIGAHVAFGVGLWAALRYWIGGRTFGLSPPRSRLGVLAACALAVVGMSAIATDAHLRHGPTTPPSPPGYLGKHLYTTWDVMEPDRLTAMWVFQRFVDPEARFHFVRPFSPEAKKEKNVPEEPSQFGTLFDQPEAEIRRTGMLAATEVLLAKQGLTGDARLGTIARVGHYWEITGTWGLAQDREALEVSNRLIAARGDCFLPEVAPCAERVFRALDAWYEQAAQAPKKP